METLIEFRNLAFTDLGKSRIKRIAVCTFTIGAVWCFADILNGGLTVNLRDDLLCIALGVIAERLIPWGKTAPATT